MKRVKLGEEPHLHIHRYVVAVSFEKKDHFHTKYHYCANLKEVRELRKVHEIRKKRKQKNAACYVEVYSATHNFREAWLND